MPRRNILAILLVSIVSLLCYRKVQTNACGRILVDAMEQIERHALKEVSQDELFEGALKGMIDQLDDRHSGYLPPKAHRELDQALKQEFGGLGIQFGYDERINQMVVFSPLLGSPAYQAGIRTGDRIIRIDGCNTQGLSNDDAKGLMRGPLGEPVTLTVIHEGDDEEVEITIVRANMQIDTVLGDTREADGAWNFFLEGHEGIGYVRIDSFGEKTATELAGVLEQLMDDNVQGLILDLRDNPGGLLGAAVNVCNLFVDDGVIVTTRKRHQEIVKQFPATRRGTVRNLPIAVLVNHDSASASEIVAACLQDHQRAIVVGERTWGKGTVQDLIELEGNRGAIRLTTATYWRPSGKDINHDEEEDENGDWGVSPDPGYELKLDPEEHARFQRWRRNRDVFRPIDNGPDPNGQPPEPFVDQQLAKAVQYVEGVVGSD